MRPAAGTAHWEGLPAHHAVNVDAVWHVARRQGVRWAHEVLQGGWRLKIARLIDGPAAGQSGRQHWLYGLQCKVAAFLGL